MIFDYKVITSAGNTETGSIDVYNKDAAIENLQKRGMIIVAIEESSKQSVLYKNFEIFAPKVKEKELVIFARQVATLFEAGVQPLKGFRLLATETDSKPLQAAITAIADDIQAGVSLSKAFGNHPKIFSKFFISMLKAGEESGKLSEVFLYLADYLERNFEITQKTKKALTYPAFVVATFILIMGVMISFVIPKLAEMVAEQGQELPMFTKAILGLSHFLTGYWYLWIPGIFVLVLYVYKFKQTEGGILYFDQMKLKIPIFKNVYSKIFLSRLADNMDTMLTSGVSIINALHITADVVDNAVFKAALDNIATKVEGGKLLSLAMQDEPLIPNVMIQMVKIGEETGELGYILKNLSRFYKREVDQSVDNMVALIEPVMILALGAGVGVLLASVMMPLYNISTGIE